MLSLFILAPGADGKKHMTRITTGDYVPLAPSRLRNILMAAWGRDGTGPGAVGRTADVLREYARVYEARRVQGLHNGPPLIEVQLCRMTWKVRSDAAHQKPRSIEPLVGVRVRDGRLFNYAAQRAADGATALAVSPATAPTTEPVEIDNPTHPGSDDEDNGDDDAAGG
jgi:hypothetical protein